MTNKILSIKDIKNADDLQTESIYIQEWGGDVILRSLTGGERDKYEKSMFTYKPNGEPKEMNLLHARARLLALSMIDADGNRLFTDSPADIAILESKSSLITGDLYEKAAELSKLNPEAIEQTEKN
jgi:hypothetical protein